MGKIITLHSNRGGVGKTLISVNLAAAFASLGKNVCLFDLDFRAPSLFGIFDLERPRYWINDFLNDQCKIREAIVDLTQRFRTRGKLFVGLANPALDSVIDMTSKDKRWEMKALRRLHSAKDEVGEDGDFILFDTSPGFLYSSVNAVACSDIIIAITTADMLDISGTQRIIKELYEAFEKATFILGNKVMPELQWREEDKDDVLKRFSTQFSVPVLAIIPCYCDILNSSKMKIYTLEKPEHPVSKVIYEAAKKLS